MKSKNIIKKIMHDTYNREIFARLRKVYLVGGFIRDVITGRHSKDRDYIVETDPVSVAHDIKKSMGGTVIHFKEESTVRVALPDGSTMDFSKVLGDIKADLESRDFTINAIAFSPREGLIDINNGIEDIMNGVIRTSTQRNLIRDPLRCLRAYRMKSDLNWSIESGTRDAIMRAKKGLEDISYERVTLEFCKMLNGMHCLDALEECFKDNVLGIIICNNNNKLSYNLKKLYEVIKASQLLPRKHRKKLHEVFSHNLTSFGMIMLEQLLYGCDLETARLTYSKQILRRLLKARRFLEVFEREGNVMDIFDSFFSSREMILDLVCLAGKERINKEAQRFIDIERKRLLTSEEVMKLTGARGKDLGSILYHLKREQFYGRIRTKKQARQFIEQMYFD